MGIQAPAKVKYQLIYEAIKSDDNKLNISYMCKFAGVSRSGFYAWINAIDSRSRREKADMADYELIKKAFDFCGYDKGARGIYMRLLHMDPPVVMNLKKIRRLMKKYHLVCPIRQPNPYRRIAKALQTSQIAPNLVNREFREHGPRKILLTDVTYLFYKNGVCYLSPIIDAFTHELLAYELSENLKVDFVLAMIDNMCSTYSAELDDETIVHSDQGFHYTSKAFIQKLEDFDFKQSMSRKGNCWDNAPQESFFGHMKDEISQRIAQSETFEEVKAIVDCWINYYNENRYQWDLEMLSPKEYYTYVTTGIYPLQKGISKQKRGSAPNPEV